MSSEHDSEREMRTVAACISRTPSCSLLVLLLSFSSPSCLRVLHDVQTPSLLTLVSHSLTPPLPSQIFSPTSGSSVSGVISLSLTLSSSSFPLSLFMLSSLPNSLLPTLRPQLPRPSFLLSRMHTLFVLSSTLSCSASHPLCPLNTISCFLLCIPSPLYHVHSLLHPLPRSRSLSPSLSVSLSDLLPPPSFSHSLLPSFSHSHVLPPLLFSLPFHRSFLSLVLLLPWALRFASPFNSHLLPSLIDP